LDRYLPLIGSVSLLLFVAAGIKYALGLRARNWIILLVVVGAALLAMFVSQLAIFVG
jgi:hypothetical protein